MRGGERRREWDGIERRGGNEIEEVERRRGEALVSEGGEGWRKRVKEKERGRDREKDGEGR